MMATQLKASLLIQIYDCPRPSFDATLTACDRPLYDYLAAQPTPWQKAERMRIVGDVERARDQAVIDCEASRFPAPAPAPEGVQITIVTKGVTPAPKPAPKGLTAIVRIDIAPQPPCPAIPFLALVAGVGFRPRMLWQGGRMAFIAPASASSLAQQITLAFDQLLDHQVWYDNDPAAPWELRQRQSPFDLTKQRVDTQGDAAHDHFHVAILYEQIDGAGRYQYDRTLTPNQDRWTLADARTGALGLLETTFDIPVPADLRGSWRQRVILWRFDRGPTPAAVTYDSHPVVSGNSHLWAFDDDEWRETRKTVMEIAREVVVPRTARAQHRADWLIWDIALPTRVLPYYGESLRAYGEISGRWTSDGRFFSSLIGAILPAAQAIERYGIPEIGGRIRVKSSDAWRVPVPGGNGAIAFTEWERGGNTDELEAYLLSKTPLPWFRNSPDYYDIAYTPLVRPLIVMSGDEFRRLAELSDPLEITFYP